MNVASEIPPKKQVSERRRLQNKQAQKNSVSCIAWDLFCDTAAKAMLMRVVGERQKRNLQLLQDIAGSRSNFLLDQAATNDASLQHSHGSSTSTWGDLESFDYDSSSNSNMPASSNLDRTGVIQNTSSTALLSPQSLPEDGIERSCSDPEETVLEEVWKSFTAEEIMESGLQALSHGVSTKKPASGCYGGKEQNANNQQVRTDRILLLRNASQEAFLPVPDIPRNNIRVKQVSFTAACVANASVLGLGFDAASCDYEISPFFRGSISEEAAKKVCQTSFKDVKEYLRPCVSQVMRAHHPYIDVLPFPTFRERLIKLAYADEPMIDEDDLCADLEKEGLICWGSSLGGGSLATGSGAPWDVRSWEAQPWIVIGGAEGEIYKQTQWWCEMRGERSCYPW